MKHLLFVLFIVASTVFNIDAQGRNDSIAAGNNEIVCTVPTTLNINDNVFVVNKTLYTILKIAVVEATESDYIIPVGTGSSIVPGERFKIAEYSNNNLRRLKGRTLIIKAKGADIDMPSSSSNEPNAGRNSRSRHKEFDQKTIDAIPREKITYDFNINMYEANHDLYIELLPGKSDKSFLDF